MAASLPPSNVPITDSHGLVARVWYRFLHNLQFGGFTASDGASGLTATVTTAKLTAGGANGSMTFKNGLLVSQTQAT